ncbi:MAG: peptidylprolyl isomerase [Flavobacteriales bacterium]|nr:peptidylprolyl isomerase [Flavobacteriales bacterium]
MKARNIIAILVFLSGIILSLSSFSQEEKPQTKILITTSMGDITIILFDDTKLHRKNFMMLVKSGQFNGSIFHRVIETFMVQGGELKNPRGPLKTIPAEIKPHYVHTKGMLSAARQGDRVNPMKESSGSQFYIVHGKKYRNADLANITKSSGFPYTAEQKKEYMEKGGTPQLDGDYTVFGQVIEGLDVVDKIAAVRTGYGDKPLVDVTMRMKIIEE